MQPLRYDRAQTSVPQKRKYNDGLEFANANRASREWTGTPRQPNSTYVRDPDPRAYSGRTYYDQRYYSRERSHYDQGYYSRQGENAGRQSHRHDYQNHYPDYRPNTQRTMPPPPLYPPSFASQAALPPGRAFAFAHNPRQPSTSASQRPITDRRPYMQQRQLLASPATQSTVSRVPFELDDDEEELEIDQRVPGTGPPISEDEDDAAQDYQFHQSTPYRSESPGLFCSPKSASPVSPFTRPPDVRYRPLRITTQVNTKISNAERPLSPACGGRVGAVDDAMGAKSSSLHTPARSDSMMEWEDVPIVGQSPGESSPTDGSKARMSTTVTRADQNPFEDGERIRRPISLTAFMKAREMGRGTSRGQDEHSSSTGGISRRNNNANQKRTGQPSGSASAWAARFSRAIDSIQARPKSATMSAQQRAQIQHPASKQRTDCAVSHLGLTEQELRSGKSTLRIPHVNGVMQKAVLRSSSLPADPHRTALDVVKNSGSKATDRRPSAVTVPSQQNTAASRPHRRKLGDIKQLDCILLQLVQDSIDKYDKPRWSEIKDTYERHSGKKNKTTEVVSRRYGQLRRAFAQINVSAFDLDAIAGGDEQEEADLNQFVQSKLNVTDLFDRDEQSGNEVDAGSVDDTHVLPSLRTTLVERVAPVVTAAARDDQSSPGEPYFNYQVQRRQADSGTTGIDSAEWLDYDRSCQSAAEASTLALKALTMDYRDIRAFKMESSIDVDTGLPTMQTTSGTNIVQIRINRTTRYQCTQLIPDQQWLAQAVYYVKERNESRIEDQDCQEGLLTRSQEHYLDDCASADLDLMNDRAIIAFANICFESNSNDAAIREIEKAALIASTRRSFEQSGQQLFKQARYTGLNKVEISVIKGKLCGARNV